MEGVQGEAAASGCSVCKRGRRRPPPRLCPFQPPPQTPSRPQSQQPAPRAHRAPLQPAAPPATRSARRPLSACRLWAPPQLWPPSAPLQQSAATSWRTTWSRRLARSVRSWRPRPRALRTRGTRRGAYSSVGRRLGLMRDLHACAGGVAQPAAVRWLQQHLLMAEGRPNSSCGTVISHAQCRPSVDPKPYRPAALRSSSSWGLPPTVLAARCSGVQCSGCSRVQHLPPMATALPFSTAPLARPHRPDCLQAGRSLWH